MEMYGSDLSSVEEFLSSEPSMKEKLHPRLPYLRGQVVWAARHEMARTVDDVLARRTRSLLLDARASIEIAEEAAQLLAGELGRDAAWVSSEASAFRTLARGYLP